MKAVYIAHFGAAENLELREVPAPPAPSGTQVLVQVRAAGLNRADLLQRLGKYPPPKGFSPNIPGMEFAGEVSAVGDDVSTFKTGDRVFGVTGGEAQAEFLVTDERLLAKIPENLEFPEAAAVPEAFITAHDAIFSQAGLVNNECLLIHAVGSGVGLAALQLAKSKGSLVIGTSRTKEKLDRCGEFGVDYPLLTAEPKFAADVLKATGGVGANVILDLVGGPYFEENLAAVAVKGRLMLVGLTAGRSANFELGMALSKRLKIIGTVLRPRDLEEKSEATRKFVDEVVPLLSDGRIRPNLDRVFPAKEVNIAYQYLESNNSFGKVVLEF
jgi:putative PIG3 family NAD(P)H quinone oxidoreductase